MYYMYIDMKGRWMAESMPNGSYAFLRFTIAKVRILSEK